MKQNDTAMLILIVSLSLMFSYFVGNALFGGNKARNAEVEMVQAITGEFPEIDTTIFNDDARNLTREIDIGGEDQTSPNPFEESTDE